MEKPLQKLEKISVKTQKIVMAAFVVGGVLLSSSFEARAVDYTRGIFFIDCRHDSIKSESTKNTVTAEFYVRKQFEGSQTTKLNCDQKNLISEPFKGATLDILISREVTEIRLFANGEDALFIDRVEWGYHNPDYIEVMKWGRDNGQGWCLSTDKKDGKSWTKQMTSVGCQPCWRFWASGDKVTNCYYKRKTF